MSNQIDRERLALEKQKSLAPTINSDYSITYSDPITGQKKIARDMDEYQSVLSSYDLEDRLSDFSKVDGNGNWNGAKAGEEMLSMPTSSTVK